MLCHLSAAHEASETEPACLDAPHHGHAGLSVSKRGSLPSPERGAEMKGLPSGPRLSPRPSSPWDKGADFKRWHCMMEHGFGIFCFLIEYEDKMKKTLVTAGRRLVKFCFFSFTFLFLFFVFVFPRRSHCVWRDIFEIFVRSPILYSKLLFLFAISSLEGPPSVQGMPYSLLPQY